MDAPDRDPDPDADLQKPVAERLRVVRGNLRAGERPGQADVQNAGEGGQIQPQRVGVEQAGRAALGEQAQLQVLDSVLRIPPGAVELLAGSRTGRVSAGSEEKIKRGLAPTPPTSGNVSSLAITRREPDQVFLVRYAKERNRLDGLPDSGLLPCVVPSLAAGCARHSLLGPGKKSVGENADVADVVETLRDAVQQIATTEPHGGKGRGAVSRRGFGLRRQLAAAEGDGLPVERQYPGTKFGDAAG